MRYVLALLYMTWLTTVPARADMSGNDLKDNCGSMSNSLCTGYIVGTLDSMRTIGEEANAPMFCLPPGVGEEQVTALVRKYLADHPERLRTRAASLIMNAMTGAYPCPK